MERPFYEMKDGCQKVEWTKQCSLDLNGLKWNGMAGANADHDAPTLVSRWWIATRCASGPRRRPQLAYLLAMPASVRLRARLSKLHGL